MLNNYTLTRIRKAGFIAEYVGASLVIKDALEWEAPTLATILKYKNELLVSDKVSGGSVVVSAKGYRELLLMLVRRFPRKGMVA